MAKVSTNISIDADVKKRATALLADFGMDLSTAVNIYLKQMLAENRIPFEIKRETPNALTAQVIAEAERGENLVGPFDSVDKLWESLNAEDRVS